MTYKAVMVYVDIDGIPEQRVRIASQVAVRFGATLIGFSARAVPSPFVAEGVIIEEVTEADIKQMRVELEKRGEWFRGIAGDIKNIEWRSALDFPGDALAEEARCADVIIIGQPLRGRYNNQRILDPREVLFKLGRPALLVAPGIASLRAEHVLVAWRDSREARRAVMDAMPFLNAAKRVSVIEICARDEEPKASARVKDVVLYLARHGITAEARPIVHRDRSDADHLFQFALDEEADLIVAGAYGHSRLGEWIFGGMTPNSRLVSCLLSDVSLAALF